MKTMLLTKTFFKHNREVRSEKTMQLEVTMLREFIGRHNIQMAEIIMPTPAGAVKRFIERSKLSEKKNA